MSDPTREERHPPPRCLLCRDVGFVIVAHPAFVKGGRLTAMRTGAVVCTNRIEDRNGEPVGCPAGARQSGPMTWDRYTFLLGGLDGVELVLEFERERLEKERLAQLAAA